MIFIIDIYTKEEVDLIVLIMQDHQDIDKSIFEIELQNEIEMNNTEIEM